jgi:hypothetical protein
VTSQNSAKRGCGGVWGGFSATQCPVVFSEGRKGGVERSQITKRRERTGVFTVHVGDSSGVFVCVYVTVFTCDVTVFK